MGSKRRRKKNEVRNLEEQVQQTYRDQMSQEVERQTKNLKNQLAQKEVEAQNNQNAATILN